MSITREQAATWFETMHPPGPTAREMYREVAKRRIEEAQAQARLAWNTRAPILSESELKKLEENT